MNLIRKSLSILLLINCMMPAIAQSPPVRNNRISKVHFVPPPVPDRGSPRGRSRGGASRTDTCKVTEQPLTALVPLSNESAWGITISEYPAFLFYVPYPLTSDSPIEFVLQDEKQNTLYQASFHPAIPSPGVVKITVPKTTVPLKIDKMYRWYFLVYCNAAEPIFVEGWVKRVAIDSNLRSQLEKAVPKDKIALMAANGIWYDAVSDLAELRLHNPQDTSSLADWESLLKSAGLDAIAKKPLFKVKVSTP